MKTDTGRAPHPSRDGSPTESIDSSTASEEKKERPKWASRGIMGAGPGAKSSLHCNLHEFL